MSINNIVTITDKSKEKKSTQAAYALNVLSAQCETASMALSGIAKSGAVSGRTKIQIEQIVDALTTAIISADIIAMDADFK